MTGKSRNSVIGFNKLAALWMNGRFSFCGAANDFGRPHFCTCKRQRRSASALGSEQSFRSALSCGRFQPPNVRETGHAFEMGGISVFREWLLPERSPNSTRCIAARRLRAQSRLRNPKSKWDGRQSLN